MAIAGFGMVGLLVTAIARDIPWQETMTIAAVIIGYVIGALVYEYIKEKTKC